MLKFRVNFLWHKEIGAKAAHKMLVKLTSFKIYTAKTELEYKSSESNLKFPLMSYPPQIKGRSWKSRPPMAASIKLGNLLIFSQLEPSVKRNYLLG